jgi:hypothetical protein
MAFVYFILFIIILTGDDEKSMEENNMIHFIIGLIVFFGFISLIIFDLIYIYLI